MSEQIDRNLYGKTFVLDANLKSPFFPIQGKAGGGLIALTGFTGTTVGFEAGVDKDSYGTLNDGAGAPVAVTIAADQAISIPEAAMKFAVLRIVASGGTVAAGQGMVVVFKS